MQTAETASPQFAGSSPIENGAICGATENHFAKDARPHLNSYPLSLLSYAYIFDDSLTSDKLIDYRVSRGMDVKLIKREDMSRIIVIVDVELTSRNATARSPRSLQNTHADDTRRQADTVLIDPRTRRGEARARTMKRL